MRHESNSHDEGFDPEIDDKLLSLSPMTPVRTTEDKLKDLEDVPPEVYQYERKWGGRGMITDTMGANCNFYEVLHDDGTLGLYHFTEFRLRYDNDVDDDDNDSGEDNEPPVEPDGAPFSEKPTLELVFSQ